MYEAKFFQVGVWWGASTAAATCMFDTVIFIWIEIKWQVILEASEVVSFVYSSCLKVGEGVSNGTPALSMS
jgi:hypothetical protein